MRLSMELKHIRVALSFTLRKYSAVYIWPTFRTDTYDAGSLPVSHY